MRQVFLSLFPEGSSETARCEKLDETAQKHVKDSLVRNVLITAWDEKDDELASLVKSKVKSALDEGKGL